MQGVRAEQDAARDEGAGDAVPARRAVGGRRLGGPARVLGVAGRHRTRGLFLANSRHPSAGPLVWLWTALGLADLDFDCSTVFLTWRGQQSLGNQAA